MANLDFYQRAVSTDQGSATVGAGISSTSVSGGPFAGVQRLVFYIFAGAGGAADDVTLLTTALPAKSFILNVQFMTIGLVAASTVTLRDAAAGAGNAYSTALSSATAGLVAVATTTRAVAAAVNTSLFLRRSDSAISGVLLVDLIQTV